MDSANTPCIRPYPHRPARRRATRPPLAAPGLGPPLSWPAGAWPACSQRDVGSCGVGSAPHTRQPGVAPAALRLHGRSGKQMPNVCWLCSSCVCPAEHSCWPPQRSTGVSFAGHNRSRLLGWMQPACMRARPFANLALCTRRPPAAGRLLSPLSNGILARRRSLLLPPCRPPAAPYRRTTLRRWQRRWPGGRSWG